MNKFKSVVKKISPFVGKYKWAFLGAILFIISAAVFKNRRINNNSIN